MGRDSYETAELLDALRVQFADGDRLGVTESLHLILEEEGMSALVDAVLDAARGRQEPDAPAPLASITPYTVQVTEYRLSILPEDHRSCDTFAVYVRWAGEGRWTVEHEPYCLGTDAVWELTRPARYLDMNAREPWLAAHRFDFDTALRMATEALPTITVNGKTAADVLAEESDRG